MMVALLSLYVSVVAEMGRVPFDNPETHYELTMIHEAMMLEYSGRLLALLHWAAWTKQLLLLSLLAALLPPYQLPSGLDFAQIGISALFYVLKILLLCGLTAIVETTIAKVRIFRNKDLMSGAFVLALLALVLAAQDFSGVLS
jgi:formate hydrogenlyase subunit 4